MPTNPEAWYFDARKANELGLKCAMAVLLAGTKAQRRIIVPTKNEYVGLMLMSRDDEVDRLST